MFVNEEAEKKNEMSTLNVEVIKDHFCYLNIKLEKNHLLIIRVPKLNYDFMGHNHTKV